MVDFVNVGLELVTLLVIVGVFIATFEPLRSRAFKKPPSPNGVLLIRIAAPLAALGCLLRIYLVLYMGW